MCMAKNIAISFEPSWVPLINFVIFRNLMYLTYRYFSLKWQLNGSTKTLHLDCSKVFQESLMNAGTWIQVWGHKLDFQRKYLPTNNGMIYIKSTNHNYLWEIEFKRLFSFSCVLHWAYIFWNFQNVTLNTKNKSIVWIMSINSKFIHIHTYVYTLKQTHIILFILISGISMEEHITF